MQKEINQLNRHVIVCGYGRIGRLVANELASTARDFVVVEEQATVVEEIVRQQMLVVEGSATDEEVLEKAGLSRAAALVAALGSDADNLLLTMTARGLNRGLDIIARAETPASSRKFSRAGANHVVLPHVIGANHIVQLLTRPSVVDFIELVTRDEDIHLEVRQIEIGPDSPFAHRTLAEAHIRQATGCMVLAIRRPGQRTVFDPQPDTRILPGDTLVAVGSCAGGRTPGAAPPTSPAS